jgi:hypothetical protein
MKLPGLTLLETLIYSALVTVIISVAILTAVTFRSSIDRDAGRMELTSNAQFVSQKIDQLTLGLMANQVVVPETQGNVLEINKGTGTSRFQLEVIDSRLALRRDTSGDGVLTSADTALFLVSRHVVVSSFSVVRSTENGQPTLRLDVVLTSGDNLTQHIERKVVLL